MWEILVQTSLCGKSSGQNNKVYVLVRYVPAKRDMQTFMASAFVKPRNSLGTFLASLKHWPVSEDITGHTSLLAGGYILYFYEPYQDVQAHTINIDTILVLSFLSFKPATRRRIVS